jgi:hypothetical protein
MELKGRAIRKILPIVRLARSHVASEKLAKNEETEIPRRNGNRLRACTRSDLKCALGSLGSPKQAFSRISTHLRARSVLKLGFLKKFLRHMAFSNSAFSRFLDLPQELLNKQLCAGPLPVQTCSSRCLLGMHLPPCLVFGGLKFCCVSPLLKGTVQQICVEKFC